MENNIIALLNNNLRVIIPDFGAFIIRQKQPRIIVFNEFLRYNDGLLIDFIVKTEGIDREIAEQRVWDFAEDGMKILASGRELVIEGLGSLRKDASGKITFTEALETAPVEEKKTEEPEKTVLQQEIQEKPEKKMAGIPKARKKPGGKKKQVQVEPPPPAEIELEPVAEPEPVIVPEPVIAPEPVIVPEPIIVPEPATNPAPVIAAPVFSENVPPPPHRYPSADIIPVNKSTNRILAWALVILFVNAVILAWFMFRNKTHGKSHKETETTLISDSIYDQLADSVRAAAEDTDLVYKEIADDNPAIAKAVAAPGSRYYIVAGCFRDEVNADSLVGSLKLLGYHAEKFGKIGNLYAVCFTSFNNKEEAVPELKKIREKYPSAWMTRF